MKRHAMTSIGWWVVDVMSRALEPDERNAVRGDLIEARSSSGRALLDVLGLVVRRQAALWLDWKPWLALAAIAVPLGLLLGHLSRRWADGSAVYAWLYVNNWTWGFLESPGARRDLLHTTVGFLLNAVTLAGWSWTAGFVLRSLSRRTSWLTGSLFCLAVLGGTVGTDTIAARNPFNPAFASMFYRIVWPALLALLVVVPVLAGLHRVAALPLVQAIVWAAAVALLTTRSAFNLGGGPLVLLLALALAWPVGYMVGIASWQRWRSRTASA